MMQLLKTNQSEEGSIYLASTRGVPMTGCKYCVLLLSCNIICLSTSFGWMFNPNSMVCRSHNPIILLTEVHRKHIKCLNCENVPF